MQIPCTFCGGSGTRWDRPNRSLRPCPICNGAGWHPEPIAGQVEPPPPEPISYDPGEGLFNNPENF